MRFKQEGRQSTKGIDYMYIYETGVLRTLQGLRVYQQLQPTYAGTTNAVVGIRREV